MAKRRPIPPYLTLPEDALEPDPADGWELLVEGVQDRIIPHRDLFPSWDSSLQFRLRKRFRFDLREFHDHLLIPSDQGVYKFVVRMETGGGLLSQVVFVQILAPQDNVLEVEVRPDSRTLSRNLALTCSIVVERVGDIVDVLSPSQVGCRVWSHVWSTKLEGGRVRLPIDTISFDKQLHDLSMPNALVHVSVADDPRLEFEQAVCVYLNADHPQFIAAFERGDRAATGMVWETIVRQTLTAGLTADFGDDGDEFPEDSLGTQLESWMRSIFPGESRAAIAVAHQQNPAVFEGRIQSWVNTGALWAEVKS